MYCTHRHRRWLFIEEFYSFKLNMLIFLFQNIGPIRWQHCTTLLSRIYVCDRTQSNERWQGLWNHSVGTGCLVPYHVTLFHFIQCWIVEFTCLFGTVFGGLVLNKHNTIAYYDNLCHHTTYEYDNVTYCWQQRSLVFLVPFLWHYILFNEDLNGCRVSTKYLDLDLGSQFFTQPMWNRYWARIRGYKTFRIRIISWSYDFLLHYTLVFIDELETHETYPFRPSLFVLISFTILLFSIEELFIPKLIFVLSMFVNVFVQRMCIVIFLLFKTWSTVICLDSLYIVSFMWHDIPYKQYFEFGQMNYMTKIYL